MSPTSARRLAVLAGGALGTALRMAVVALVPVAPPAFPWSTFAVNVAGAAALGALVGRARRRASAGADAATLRAFAGAGVLGAFTTFSAFAVEGVRLLDQAPATAAAYTGASLVVGVTAALAGDRLAGTATVPR